jgi:prolyl oligopeptidase
MSNSKFEAAFSYVTNDGPLFWFETTLNAPNKKIVKYDLNAPEKGFQQVVPETKDVLDSLDIVDNDKLVLVYLQDVKVI